MARTTYLNIVADQGQHVIATVFSEGSGLFQQDNAPCHTAKLVQEWFVEERAQGVALATFTRSQSNPALCGMC